jgi:flagella basal body P-ring formation protein FlgA
MRHRKYCATRWLASLLCAGLPLWSGAAAAQMIELRSNKSVQGAMVLLRDIAHSPNALPEAWREREIVQAPQPGQPLQVSLTTIATALNQYPDMQHVVLRGEARLSLQRVGALLAAEKLLAAIRAFAEDHPPWQSAELHVECEHADIEIPASEQEPEIRVLDMASDDRPNHYRFSIAIATSDGSSRNATVTAKVEPMQKVWVATRPLARGHVLAEQDLDALWLPPDSAKSFLSGEDTVLGLEANRDIRARQPLAAHFLAQPVSARRGDTVSVTALRGGLQVALRATALATGRRGERIMCMNETSRRRFLVRLTDVREATVDF